MPTEKEKSLVEFSLYINRASYDKKTNTRRWAATASDTGDDVFLDNMSVQLFRSFIERISTKAHPPVEYRSEFWQGGMPYVSVSHYSDLNGKAVPGMADSVYIDGDMLKAKGTFFDNPIGRAAFESVCADLYGDTKPEKPVRISIAFLDYEHTHKSNGYHFTRKSIDDVCPQCLVEDYNQSGQGKVYLDGHLIHLAMTRVPANRRTLMEVEKAMTTRKEDAESIVGAEIAKSLEEESALVGKALVIKSAEMGSENPEDMDEEDKDEEEKEEAAMNKKGKKEEYKAEFPAEWKSEIVAIVKSALEEKSVAVKPSHPLDAALELFKGDYTNVTAMSVEPKEKLAMLQKSFEELAMTVTKSLAPVQEEQPVEQAQPDLVKALSEAMLPIAQKLDLVATMLQERSEAKPAQPANLSAPNAPVAPPRRSISPNAVQKSVMDAATPKSATPKLRQIIERTTY